MRLQTNSQRHLAFLLFHASSQS